MIFKRLIFLLVYLSIGSLLPAWAANTIPYEYEGSPCLKDRAQRYHPVISFIEYQSLDLEQKPPAPITIKGKLKLPVKYSREHGCYTLQENVPAVVVMHGSAGVDFRGDFYAQLLNFSGIATLEIDMWGPRGVVTAADRPPLPLFNLPDAFGALRVLSEHPNIDPERIGALGFSWGGVVTLAAAVEANAAKFGGPLRFAAHIAHYPVCYAYNSAIPGSDFFGLTGAPIMIQVGDQDDYDMGAEACLFVKQSLSEEEQDLVKVRVYEGATHGWDRLQVPAVFFDPFAHLGAGGDVRVNPDVEQAYKARSRVVRFFRSHLMD